MQGAAQLSVNPLAPDKDTGSLKAAVIKAVLSATPVESFTGTTAVTTGAAAIGSGVMTVAPDPRIGSRPPPHPATKALSSSAASQTCWLDWLVDDFN